MASAPAYNGRPRKVLPDNNKEFPTMLNGMSLMTSPNPVLASQNLMPTFERPNAASSPSNSQITRPSQDGTAPPGTSNTAEANPEPQQLTAIFRPDDAGEWKEKLRVLHEASIAAGNRGPGWETSSSGDEDSREDEGDFEEGEAVIDGASESGEEGSKTWKPRRTLRK
jgi:striatin 1/3/4